MPTFALGVEDDEGGEVVVGSAESVLQPGSDGRAAGKLRSGLEVGHTGAMVDGLGIHVFDDTNVVGNFGGVRENFGERLARVTVLGELERRTGEGDGGLVARHAGEALATADLVGKLLAMHLVEERLGIVEIELGGATGLEEEDDPLRFGGKL